MTSKTKKITIIGVPLFRFLNNKYSKLLKDILS